MHTIYRRSAGAEGLVLSSLAVLLGRAPSCRRPDGPVSQGRVLSGFASLRHCVPAAKAAALPPAHALRPQPPYAPSLRSAHLVRLTYFLWLVGLLTACTPQPESGAAGPRRIISLSGTLTETVFALGKGADLVGIDITSTYPADSLQALPKLGHVRQASLEGVLSLKPDLVLAEQKDAELPLLQAIQDAGIRLVCLPVDYSLEGPALLADTLGRLLGVPVAGQQVRDQIKQATASLAAARPAQRPKVLFVYARGAGNLQVAGTDTSADAMITLAGGQNAMRSFSGFRPLSTEGLVAAQPDVLLFFDSGLASLGGPSGVLQIPGVAQVPAGKNKQIIGMDGLYLLGFTPRLPQAVAELRQFLYGPNSESTTSSQGL